MATLTAGTDRPPGERLVTDLLSETDLEWVAAACSSGRGFRHRDLHTRRAGRTSLRQTGTGRWRVSDTLQAEAHPGLPRPYGDYRPIGCYRGRRPR